MAVASSCSIAIGLTKWLKQSTGLSANARNFLGRTVPFAAVGTAGVLNGEQKVYIFEINLISFSVLDETKRIERRYGLFNELRI